MPESIARLYLITPVIDDAEAFGPRLAEAAAGGDAACVLFRLAGADERTLINQLKLLAPPAQERGAAVMIAAPGDVDLATIAIRGGADGVHVSEEHGRVAMLRERLKGERSLGAGGLRTKHDAMTVAEAGVDYVMFGEPRADGSVPEFDGVLERAAWWAEIFETPCVAFAASLETVAELAATGVEFVALGEAVWGHPDGPAAAVRLAGEALRAHSMAGA
jgi:thiamine-phosphate pyrophosphorylase